MDEKGTPPDLLLVQIVDEHEIAAARADLLVTVRGSSLVTGQAALNKAREVNKLVTDLTGFGLPAEAITIESVRADVSSSLLGKSSSASYTLKIHCAELDKLADVLGIVTSQKNVSLDSIQWGYPDNEESRQERLVGCLARARQKGQRMAEALSVKLGVPHLVKETWLDSEPPPVASLDVMPRAAQVTMRTRVSREELGMDVGHKKQLRLTVEVHFRVVTIS
jgi:hypothetical protein